MARQTDASIRPVYLIFLVLWCVFQTEYVIDGHPIRFNQRRTYAHDILRQTYANTTQAGFLQCSLYNNPWLLWEIHYLSSLAYWIFNHSV